jgi:hypothetical protein
VKARKYKYPTARPCAVEVGWLRGRASRGAAALSERCSVVTYTTKSSPGGSAQGQLWSRERRAPGKWAKAGVGGEENRTQAPVGLPGVWAVAPRPGSVAQSGEGLRAKPRRDRMAEDPAYNREAGSRREGRRPAAEAVRAMTVGTTQPRPSKGPLGERGRGRGDRPGRLLPPGSYLRPDRKVVWVEDPGAAKAVCHLGTTSRCCWAGQRARRAVVVWGMPPLRGAGFQPDWGKPNVRMIGGRVETSRSEEPACNRAKSPAAYASASGSRCASVGAPPGYPAAR